MPSVGDSIKEDAEASSEEEGACVLDVPEKVESSSIATAVSSSSAVNAVSGGSNATVKGVTSTTVKDVTSTTVKDVTSTAVKGVTSTTVKDVTGTAASGAAPPILSSLLANGENKDDSELSLRPELQLHVSTAAPEKVENASLVDLRQKGVAARCGKPMPCSVALWRSADA